MWALRRASVPLRERRFSIGTFRSCFADSEVSITHIQDKATIFESPLLISDVYIPLKRFYHTDRASVYQFMCRRGLSSEAGTKSSGEEDDLEEGFSELETPASTDAVRLIDAEDEDELISEPEFSDVDAEPSQNELELSDTENDPCRGRPSRTGSASALFKAIMASPGLSVNDALDKWVEQGNELSRSEISMAMLSFRKHRLYGRALQLSEWLEAKNQLEFVEKDYASRLDLISKVCGLHEAEKYVDKIPKSFQSELIYRTLLGNCVKANNLKKAEEVFNKMDELEFPITAFACNQLLLLYKRFDMKKMADVLLLMERENVKPTRETYILLIEAKGKSNDIEAMDQIVEAMEAEGIELDLDTQSIMARHYVHCGLTEKAEAVLKEMEGGNLKGNRRACQHLLYLYAGLGKADDVGRVWKVCESKPFIGECIAAIEAYGKLNKIEEAEAIFENAVTKYKKPPAKLFNVLLMVYAKNKMVAIGKDLVKRMADSGCMIGPFTWDALVKLYVEAGEVEKADSILQKAAQQNQMRPLFCSYMAIMHQYAKRGDIHNTEKVFYRMRQAGYTTRFYQYETLVQAYVNAKAPAYGMTERMKADNIFPTISLSVDLQQIDAFRKTAASDLLD